MWVRGDQGTKRNEQADRREKLEVELGERMHKPDIATPAGPPIAPESAGTSGVV